MEEAAGVAFLAGGCSFCYCFTCLVRRIKVELSLILLLFFGFYSLMAVSLMVWHFWESPVSWPQEFVVLMAPLGHPALVVAIAVITTLYSSAYMIVSACKVLVPEENPQGESILTIPVKKLTNEQMRQLQMHANRYRKERDECRAKSDKIKTEYNKLKNQLRP